MIEQQSLELGTQRPQGTGLDLDKRALGVDGVDSESGDGDLGAAAGLGAVAQLQLTMQGRFHPWNSRDGERC
jgi:hypothetical protein